MHLFPDIYDQAYQNIKKKLKESIRCPENYHHEDAISLCCKYVGGMVALWLACAGLQIEWSRFEYWLAHCVISVLVKDTLLS